MPFVDINNVTNKTPGTQGAVPAPQATQPVTAPPIPPVTPAVTPAPVAQQSTDYAAMMDEEHPLMRNVPHLDDSLAAQGEVKIVEGPALPGATPVAPIAAPVISTLPVDPTITGQTLSAITAPELDDASKTHRAQLDDLLTLAVEKNASDLHIAAGFPPMLRVDGRLLNVGSQEMVPQRVEKMMMSILNERQIEQYQKYSDVDLSYPHKSGNRFRVNVYAHKGALAGAFRLIPSQIKSISDLSLPQVCYDLIKVPQGLILLTGPTGSGKSTSIAAMIQEINLNYNKHIITIEDPIEYVFPKAKSLVNQREIGQDVYSFERGLREMLREDPNVVLVGEMRDFETIAHTITVAETGHLVFTTLHTNSASQTIDRIIDVFPEGQQNQVRSQLANVITAVIAQRLIPVNRGGRKAVFEVMIATPGVKNAIREGKTYQIDNMIQTNLDLGMITLEKSLLQLIKSGDLSIDDAMSYTAKPDELMSLINNGK